MSTTETKPVSGGSPWLHKLVWISLGHFWGAFGTCCRWAAGSTAKISGRGRGGHGMPCYLGVWVTPVTVQTQPLAQEALGSLGMRGSPVGMQGAPGCAPTLAASSPRAPTAASGTWNVTEGSCGKSLPQSQEPTAGPRELPGHDSARRAGKKHHCLLEWAEMV